MPRPKKNLTISDEVDALTVHQAQQCNYFDKNGRCPEYGPIVKTHVMKPCITPSGDRAMKLVAVGYCQEHDLDTENMESTRNETVAEYFQRTYLHALENDPIVRAAASERDKSLLLQMLKARILEMFDKWEQVK